MFVPYFIVRHKLTKFEIIIIQKKNSFSSACECVCESVCVRICVGVCVSECMYMCLMVCLGVYVYECMCISV